MGKRGLASMTCCLEFHLGYIKGNRHKTDAPRETILLWKISRVIVYVNRYAPGQEILRFGVDPHIDVAP
jgi:hypothetical protein